MIIFNGHLEIFKNPLGAIKENEKVTLNIHIKRDFTYTPKVILYKRKNYDKYFYKSYQMKWTDFTKNYDVYSVEFSVAEYGNYYYSFLMNDDENIFPDIYELLVYKENYKTPKWIKGGIIYHIFVDRFNKVGVSAKNRNDIIYRNWGETPYYKPNKNEKILNNDFFGGNLQGIIEKLPFIHSLGVNLIYLSPIFEAYSNHKYDVGDFYKIDPMFGDEKIFMDLCKEANKLNMGIILDMVLNHTGDDSIYFNKYNNYDSVGAYQSKNSPYYKWYTFKHYNNNYDCWWGIKTLPALNKQNESYIDFIMGDDGVLKHWIKKGASGYRLDVADELPNEFLNALRDSVKGENENAFIVGEVWEDAANKFSYGSLKEYFLGNQLDSVTNYPLKESIISYIKTRNCQMLYQTMNMLIEKYPRHVLNCLMNILGTHDTARILTALGSKTTPHTKDEMAELYLTDEEKAAGINMLKIASLLQFTLPGVPCIYYGDEAGMEGWIDPFNRRCYPWGNENKEILEHYKFLGTLRKNNIFKEGRYKCLMHEGGVFVFERYDESSKIVIGINLSSEKVSLNFSASMTEYDYFKKSNSFEIKSGNYKILLNNFNTF